MSRRRESWDSIRGTCSVVGGELRALRDHLTVIWGASTEDVKLMADLKREDRVEPFLPAYPLGSTKTYPVGDDGLTDLGRATEPMNGDGGPTHRPWESVLARVPGGMIRPQDLQGVPEPDPENNVPYPSGPPPSLGIPDVDISFRADEEGEPI